VATPEWPEPVHASSRLTEQKPAYMPRHRAVSVVEVGLSAVLAEGLVRAFIGATDGGPST
jgi:hypothetical protein